MNMSSNNKNFYKDNIIKFISDELFIEITDEEINNSLEEIGIDSVDTFKILYYIEEDLHIDIKNSEMNKENFYSIGKIINFCERKMGNECSR